MSQAVLLQPREPELTFCIDELPVLTAQIVLPHWERRANSRFNRYYRACAESFTRACRREILPRAEAAYYRARENALAIPQWQAQLCSTVTLQRQHLISLRTDAHIVGMPHRHAGRRGDTWDLRCDLLLSLSDCFPPQAPWRRLVTEPVCRQIRSAEASGAAHYHDGWQQKIHRAFHPHNFYLTEEGLCIFFPPDTLAPPSEGIPTFCLPYHRETGPFIPDA